MKIISNRHRKDLYLGIDLGGTKILSIVASSQGKILSRDRTHTPAKGGPEAVIRAILKSIAHALKSADITKNKIRAIGIGAAGISNPETGILYTSPNLPGWKDVPIRDIIQREIGINTFLTNDAKAAALGELSFGAGKGARNLIYITLSTGIGGGLIIDGKLYGGAAGAAGEIGHMTIDINGPHCNCGNTGCWEILASGTALAREAKKQIEQGAGTTILSYSKGKIELVTAQTVYAAALEGDRLAVELIGQNGSYVGVGLANLINIFNPELIIIGGGLSHMGDMLLKPAMAVIKERAFKASYEAVRLTIAQLGDDVGALGAIVFAQQGMKHIDR